MVYIGILKAWQHLARSSAELPLVRYFQSLLSREPFVHVNLYVVSSTFWEILYKTYLSQRNIYTGKEFGGTSLVVQWWRLCASNVGNRSSIPGWWTKIPHAVWWPENKKQNTNSDSVDLGWGPRVCISDLFLGDANAAGPERAHWIKRISDDTKGTCMGTIRSVYSCLLEESWEGNGTPLQYSCLENPMDEGAW